MTRFSLLLCYLLLTFFSFAQPPAERQPDGGGPADNTPRDEITPAERAEIIRLLKRSTAELEQRNILPPPSQYRTMHVAFSWPLRQATGFTDNGYFGISNYVDQNPAYPNQLLDYNCGNRTYDLSGGYNHAGTDIFTWPFSWQKMAQNAVEVIAGAPGIIIYKSDGNFDQNCAFCTSACNWNAVYIQHADGSVAWYGHLKSGSLTGKAVGQSVATGEYLGVVGSSGNSTGPHLHFEVYTNNTYTQLVDPWGGPCNGMNGTTSWWAAQEAYRVPTPNKVMTHNVAPVNGSCAAGEAPNQRLNFSPGQTVYFGSYYRDNLNATSATHRIYRPDNSIWQAWTQTFNNSFNASWWYYFWTLPTGGVLNGVWRYEVTYNSQTVSTNFGVNTTLPLNLVSFTAEKRGQQVHLNWVTENESHTARFEVEKSRDGASFETIASVDAKSTAGRNVYSADDNRHLSGKIFYRLKMIDKDAQFKYSHTAIITSAPKKITVEAWPTVFTDHLRLKLNGEAGTANLRLLNAKGQVVWKNKAAGADNINLPTSKYASGLYLLLVSEQNEIRQRIKLVKQ